MHINKIRITNFKSIYEPIELDFNNIYGFWKISGNVGSGKTTIGEAIIFGLFGSITGKNNADLISWGTKHGSIEINCESKGRSIYIKRELNTYGQSPIYVEVDGEEIIFTNKRDAQQQLENEYYDISKTTLELLCIISFNNFKSLATLNTSDTKKFLDQVLGFYTLTEYSDKCKELKSNNMYQINSINNSIDKINSQILKIEELSNMEIINGNISEVDSNIESIKSNIKNIQAESDKILSKIKKEINEKNKKLSSLLALGKNKAKEIDFIKKGTCPTCGAPIDQSKLNIKIKEKEILLEQYQVLNKEIISLDEKLQQEKKIMEDNIAPHRSALISQENLRIRLQEQTRRMNVNVNEIENLNKKLKQFDDDLNELTKDDAEWDSLLDILSNQARAKILSSFIPILNKNILKYSQRLHQPYLISFDENFKCNISLCGFKQEISISSLSTGQLKTVDMIVILGILGTIIGSASTNIIFLDELFSNLDFNLRNEMCMVLKESLNANRTIFIISHQEMDDKYFDGSISLSLEQKNQYEKHTLIDIKKYN